MKTDIPSPSKAQLWTGRILTGLPALLFTFSASMKLAQPPQLAEGFTHFGIPLSQALGLGVVELACAILILIPRTAVVGAVLLTGYIGGAIEANLRIGDPVYVLVVVGLAIWSGVALREPRLRALLPLRR